MVMKLIHSNSNICLYIKALLFWGLFIIFRAAYSAESYELQASVNDEKFLINDEEFEAKTYCFNMERGDQIIFMDGSSLGACVSATLYNTRTKQTCEVWCSD